MEALIIHFIFISVFDCCINITVHHASSVPSFNFFCIFDYVSFNFNFIRINFKFHFSVIFIYFCSLFCQCQFIFKKCLGCSFLFPVFLFINLFSVFFVVVFLHFAFICNNYPVLCWYLYYVNDIITILFICCFKSFITADT